jgi:LmbE family N-acetylglucosaminyl deacetylase
LKNERILVVAAHSDDETLGAGGTIARLISEGSEVHCLFLTDGVSSRADAGPQASASREKSARKAMGILGVTEFSFLEFPDNMLDSQPLLSVARAVEESVKEIRPNIVFTHSLADLNVDHVVAARATLVATRPQDEFAVQEVLSFEVPSSSEWSFGSEQTFRPNVYYDVSEFLERKMGALHCYGEEIRPSPHARSEEKIRSLASYRGGAVGVQYAEAFQLLRQIR